MKDLIKALTILLKYGNPKYPTCCDHDILHISGINCLRVTALDKKRLKKLGFEYSSGSGGFYSYRYGSN